MKKIVLNMTMNEMKMLDLYRNYGFLVNLLNQNMRCILIKKHGVHIKKSIDSMDSVHAYQQLDVLLYLAH